MAWKQDLAKLKQQIGPETPVPAVRIPPKPVPKPSGPATLDDEDAVFLSAMGLKSAGSQPVRSLPVEDAASGLRPSASSDPETFQAAVRDLKGLKPMATGPLPQPPAQPPSPPVGPDQPNLLAEPAPPPVAAIPISASTSPDPAPLPPPSRPSRFQLAAGMAIEVDGVLDLRNHSLSDAIERLKDRLGDGLVLGWRSLLVTLGTDPALHDGLLALLASGEAPMVARYAQAPVPMGGTQAWLLYFTLPLP